MLGDLLYADKLKPRVAEIEWRELVHAIGRADQFALRALYERTHRLVFTLIVRTTHDSAIAADATVDVFCDVWRNAPQFHCLDESVLGWVMNLARDRAVDRSREHSAHRVRRDRRQQVERAVAHLTRSERIAIEGCILFGIDVHRSGSGARSSARRGQKTDPFRNGAPCTGSGRRTDAALGACDT